MKSNQYPSHKKAYFLQNVYDACFEFRISGFEEPPPPKKLSGVDIIYQSSRLDDMDINGASGMRNTSLIFILIIILYPYPIPHLNEVGAGIGNPY